MDKNKTVHMSAFQQLSWPATVWRLQPGMEAIAIPTLCRQPPHAKLKANSCGLSRVVDEEKYFKTTHFRVYDF